MLDSDELEIKDVLTKQELEPLTALTKQLEKIYTELYPKTEEAIILDKNAEIIYSKALLEA